MVINAVESHHGDVEPTISDRLHRTGSRYHFCRQTGRQKRDSGDIYQSD